MMPVGQIEMVALIGQIVGDMVPFVSRSFGKQPLGLVNFLQLCPSSLVSGHWTHWQIPVFDVAKMKNFVPVVQSAPFALCF